MSRRTDTSVMLYKFIYTDGGTVISVILIQHWSVMTPIIISVSQQPGINERVLLIYKYTSYHTIPVQHTVYTTCLT